jgi:cytochrome c-type biogenesis protein
MSVVLVLRPQRDGRGQRKQKQRGWCSFHSFSLFLDSLNPDLSSPILAIPVLFAGGVLTSLNPCIWPMIPITAAIVGGQQLPGVNQTTSRARPILLTLTYVVGLAGVYSVLGVIAGMSGTLFGSVSTNPWLYFGMANLLVISALAMFDVLPVPVPRSLLDRASRAGTAGRFSGAFVMGAVSGLVAAPCGAPIMAAVLTWVTTTQSGALGFVYLLSFSLGMCAFLIVVGVSSAALARLPRPGALMVWVKRGFGFVMLGVAEYYLIRMGQLLI